jgi:hypothetical protein
MIQIYINLPKTSYLFKTLKKKNLLNYRKETLFIWLHYKPAIGELIEISSFNVTNDKLKDYLHYRKKPIIVRVIDLKQSWIPDSSNKGITVLELKGQEDYSFNL